MSIGFGADAFLLCLEGVCPRYVGREARDYSTVLQAFASPASDPFTIRGRQKTSVFGHSQFVIRELQIHLIFGYTSLFFEEGSIPQLGYFLLLNYFGRLIRVL
jgi:hypothetical protein